MTLPAWAGLEKAVQDDLRSVPLQQLIDQAAEQPENIGDYPCEV